MTSTIIEFRDLLVRAERLTLLDIPAFHLEAGELLSLVGPNGSGKTTLLHVAALLRLPDAGTVTFKGEQIGASNTTSLRRGISIVFQDPLLFSVTVLDNAAAGLRFQGMRRDAAERRAMELLHLFGVAQLANRKRSRLSGGEAARVALARAFATDPELLLLDEPFSALDAGSRAALLPELRERLTERGAAAILVTHDLAEAFAFASRLVLLDGGVIIADGDARNLATRPPSLRAARLLGAENVIPGRVIACERGLATVEIAAGIQLLAASRCHLDSASHVSLAIPAHLIRLLSQEDPAPVGWNALAASVSAVTPQLGWDQITLCVAGNTLIVREAWQPGGCRWASGDLLLATFPPDAAWAIAGDRAG